MGSLYLRGKTWWMKYYVAGEPKRESTGEKVKMKAREVLKRVEGDVAQGKRPYIEFSKIKYTHLTKLILNDYKINEQDSKRLKVSLKSLNSFFENFNVPSITSQRISEYIDSRMENGNANATINRELSALKRMFKLGLEQSPPIVNKMPVIKMLKERNIRTGFFEHDEFLSIRENLPTYLHGVITFGYLYGWRTEEITSLKWSSVDRQKWIVRLEVGIAKGDEGRTIYLDPELIDIFKSLWEERKRRNKILPYVFTNLYGKDRIKDFRRSWNKAFEITGIEKKHFHDLRRTAVRNMVRAGIPERVAMQISGHKTRSVFDRYNIVNDNDLKTAQKSISNFMGTIPGTVVPINQKKIS